MEKHKRISYLSKGIDSLIEKDQTGKKHTKKFLGKWKVMVYLW